jgi:hypothetical protein
LGADSDLHVLCDEHPHALMTLSPLIRKVKAGRKVVFAFVCTEPGCRRLFNPIQGYFTIALDGSVEPDSMRFVPCPEDQQAMFICDFSSKTREVLWRCTRLVCEARSIAAARP